MVGTMGMDLAMVRSKLNRTLDGLTRMTSAPNGACTFCGDRATIFSPVFILLRSIVVETSFGLMSLMTFDDPRSRTCTILVVSPVTSSLAGMFRYSSGTSIPISEEVSVATVIQSIVARLNEMILRCQLCAIRFFEDLMFSRPHDA